ncbi:MAG TPA: transcription antitermination factor NusB [Bacteroidia bacterium]|nr:transcription antitermination factor NusB [Bacteroidia bacterium]
MLSRRHLRIRVLQGLYSYYQSHHKDAVKTEHEIFKGIDNTYDLYIYLLLFFTGLAGQEQIHRVDLPPKFITSDTAKPVINSFSENKVVMILSENAALTKIAKKNSISWQADTELLKKSFHQLKITDEYKRYVTTADHTIQQDTEFCIWLFKKLVIESDLFLNTIEEKNIYWMDGFQFAGSMVLRAIKTIPGHAHEFTPGYIYKDEKDDRQFVKLLLHNTIKNDEWFTKLIDDKTKNWDVERIALMDVILLKMSLCEVLHLPTVPVKVSINEYLDIAKDFSTPKSNHFINGIIDKLVMDLKNENKIVKTGRGLVE